MSLVGGELLPITIATTPNTSGSIATDVVRTTAQSSTIHAASVAPTPNTNVPALTGMGGSLGRGGDTHHMSQGSAAVVPDTPGDTPSSARAAAAGGGGVRMGSSRGIHRTLSSGRMGARSQSRRQSGGSQHRSSAPNVFLLDSAGSASGAGESHGGAGTATLHEIDHDDDEVEHTADSCFQTGCIGLVSSLVDAVIDTAVGRLIARVARWAFGVHFMKPDDPYDVVLRIAILSAAPSLLLIGIPTPYYLYRVFGTEEGRNAPAAERASLCAFGFVMVVWLGMCTGVCAFCRLTGRFPRYLMDVFLFPSTLAIFVAVICRITISIELYSFGVVLFAMLTRCRLTMPFIIVSGISLTLKGLNIITENRLSVNNTYPAPPYETGFYFMMGVVSFVMCVVAVTMAVGMIEKKTEKLQSAAVLGRRLAKFTRYYDVERMRAALDKYALDPCCDTLLLETQRAVLENLESYRPHIPSYLIPDAAELPSDSDSDDSEATSDEYRGSGANPGSDRGTLPSMQHAAGDEPHEHEEDAAPHDANLLFARRARRRDRRTSGVDSEIPSEQTSSTVSVAVVDIDSGRARGRHGVVPAPASHSGSTASGSAASGASSAMSGAAFRGVVTFVRLGVHGRGARPVFTGLLGPAASGSSSTGPLPRRSVTITTPSSSGPLTVAGGGGAQLLPLDRDDQLTAAVSADGGAARIRNVTRYVELVLIECFRAAEATQGSVLCAVGDEITIAWNATKRAARPGVKACTFALHMAESMKRLATQHPPSHSPAPPEARGVKAGPGPVRGPMRVPLSAAALNEGGGGKAVLPPAIIGVNEMASAACDVLFSCHATTTPASCASAGDAKQRLFATVALGQWHQRRNGLARIARDLAVLGSHVAAEVGPAVVGPGVVGKGLQNLGSMQSPNSIGALEASGSFNAAPLVTAPPLITVVDFATQEAAQFSHILHPVGFLDDAADAALRPRRDVAAASGGCVGPCACSSGHDGCSASTAGAWSSCGDPGHGYSVEAACGAAGEHGDGSTVRHVLPFYAASTSPPSSPAAGTMGGHNSFASRTMQQTDAAAATSKHNAMTAASGRSPRSVPSAAASLPSLDLSGVAASAKPTTTSGSKRRSSKSPSAAPEKKSRSGRVTHRSDGSPLASAGTSATLPPPAVLPSTSAQVPPHAIGTMDAKPSGLAVVAGRPHRAGAIPRPRGANVPTPTGDAAARAGESQRRVVYALVGEQVDTGIEDEWMYQLESNSASVVHAVNAAVGTLAVPVTQVPVPTAAALPRTTTTDAAAAATAMIAQTLAGAAPQQQQRHLYAALKAATKGVAEALADASTFIDAKTTGTAAGDANLAHDVAWALCEAAATALTDQLTPWRHVLCGSAGLQRAGAGNNAQAPPPPLPIAAAMPNFVHNRACVLHLESAVAALAGLAAGVCALESQRAVCPECSGFITAKLFPE